MCKSYTKWMQIIHHTWNISVVHDISPVFKDSSVWDAVCVAFVSSNCLTCIYVCLLIVSSGFTVFPPCWAEIISSLHRTSGVKGCHSSLWGRRWVSKKPEALRTLRDVEGESSHAIQQHLNRTEGILNEEERSNNLVDIWSSCPKDQAFECWWCLVF